MMKTRITVFLALVATSFAFIGPAHAESTVTRVTSNLFEDGRPEIQGNYVVWQGYVDGDWEIFVYDMGTGETQQITENNYNDTSPCTDGKYVAWVGFSRLGGEIFLYRIGDPAPRTGDENAITDDDYIDHSPQIANGRVVWVSNQVTDSVGPENIFLYDAGIIIQLTDNASEISSPRISNEGVTWLQPDPLDRKNNLVYVYDFETRTTSLSSTPVWKNPRCDGDLSVVTRLDGYDRDLFVLNKRLGKEEQLTRNDVEDRYPGISGNHLAWASGVGEASEIYVATYKFLALLTPRDGTVVPYKSTPPTFGWEGMGYDRFKLELSDREDFGGRNTFTLPLMGSTLSETSFVPAVWEWLYVQLTGVAADRIFWRVQGMDAKGDVGLSDAASFSIDRRNNVSPRPRRRF